MRVDAGPLVCRIQTVFGCYGKRKDATGSVVECVLMVMHLLLLIMGLECSGSLSQCYCWLSLLFLRFRGMLIFPPRCIKSNQFRSINFGVLENISLELHIFCAM